jgi:hypothetical protein
MSATRPTLDWERIEVEYRAGILTLREIAAKHGITHGAVNKRAKRDGWARDLTQKIQAKADELVSKAVVSSAVSTTKAVTEAQSVAAHAHALADVKLRQRGDLQSLGAERNALLEELSFQRENMLTLEAATEILASLEDKPADANELRKVFTRAVSLPSRASVLKAVAEIDAKRIPLERQSWSITDEKPKDTGDFQDLTDDELTRRINERLGPARGA